MVCILSMCYCVHIPAPDLISLCQVVGQLVNRLLMVPCLPSPDFSDEEIPSEVEVAGNTPRVGHWVSFFPNIL